MIILEEVDRELDRLNKVNDELQHFIDISNERLERIKNPPIVNPSKGKLRLEDLLYAD